ncbi:hypothetical protein ASU33_12130 [Solirubrum puertoriconensis]|uniref:Uncharacterized protein n=1 Tax=Solirubrum puertoriconensis TaxID=1751427 RepID=A0A9X0HN18_SOLP1|nr:hypothetical protein ASU33_12130 [Solirubrum puertoriconensis]
MALPLQRVAEPRQTLAMRQAVQRHLGVKTSASSEVKTGYRAGSKNRAQHLLYECSNVTMYYKHRLFGSPTQ